MCIGLCGKERGKKKISVYTGNQNATLIASLLFQMYRLIYVHKDLQEEYSHKTPVFVALKLCYDFTHTGMAPPAPARVNEQSMPQNLSE